MKKKVKNQPYFWGFYTLRLTRYRHTNAKRASIGDLGGFSGSSFSSRLSGKPNGSTIYQKTNTCFVAQIGIFLVLGVVISIMAVSMYVYVDTSTSIIEVNSPEKVTVGPVEYIVSFEEIHKGNEKTVPENTFVQVRITAENISDEKALVSKEQFYIMKDNKRYNAVYGEFSSNDLESEWVDPGKSIEKTTQFDIMFDEEMQYKVVLRPNSGQLGADTAIICITQC